MKMLLRAIAIFMFLTVLCYNVKAQSNQTVMNGTATAPVIFPVECIYNWTNNLPGIGLAANGTGNIASFTAVNNGNTPVTATITAVPVAAGYAYIANTDDNTVSVVNTVTNAVIATLPVGTSPIGVSANKSESLIYVVNNGSNTVSVIDGITHTVTKTIKVGTHPYNVLISPDGESAYVTNDGDTTLSVIATKTNTVVANIPVGIHNLCMAISADGTQLYVTSFFSHTLTTVSTISGKIINTVKINVQPWGVAITPDGRQIYMGSPNAGTVTVLNTITNTMSTIIAGIDPQTLTVSPDGKNVYVLNSGSNTVSVISTATNKITATIPVGSLPSGVCTNADGSLLYVVNLDSNSVSVISTATYTIIATIDVGVHPNTIGNFITGVVSCAPVTFTITVDPTPVTTVTVKPDALIVPNAFTPNNDGINDNWVIKNINNYPGCTVQVFNRYGTRIFFSTNYPVPWNGRYKQASVAAGTYYYIIDLKNGTKPLSGSLTVIK